MWDRRGYYGEGERVVVIAEGQPERGSAEDVPGCVALQQAFGRAEFAALIQVPDRERDCLGRDAEQAMEGWGIK